MHLPLVREIINWASIPLLAALAGVLIWRKAVREFPYFFYYICIGELIVLVRLCLYDRYSLVYFYVYWTTDVLIALAALLATYELFVRRLFPRFHTVRFYQYLFPAAAIVIVLVAAPAALQLNKVWIIIRAIHVLDVLRAAILAFFVGLMLFMGRRWGRYEFGIALGLGVQASALLLTSASWTRDVLLRGLTTELPPLAYDIACLIWLMTFLKRDDSLNSKAMPLRPEVVQEARKWERTVKESLTGKKHEE